MLSAKEIQIENGEYTRVHNAILEAFAYVRLNGSEFRCVMFLIRKTYGWNKKEDRISLSQWEEGTKIKRSHVIKILAGLVAKKIMYRIDESNNQIPVYGFNKYIDQWEDIEIDHSIGERFNKSEVLPKKVTVTLQGTSTIQGNSTVTIQGTRTSTIQGTHKRHIKDTIKDNSHQLIFSSLARVCKVDPKLKGAMIGKIAKSLLAADYKADDVDRFEKWWRGNDFRGKQGDPPTLNQVVDLIMRSKSAPVIPKNLSETVTVILPSGEITEAKR